MPQIDDLRALLQHELEDLYSAETQLIDALPKMAERASDTKLRKAFNDHLKVTREHRKRLDKVQQILGNEKASEANKGFFARLFSGSEGSTHCKAMEGLIKEANSLMSEDMNEQVLDAALIAAAQKVEHYEISSYGTARAYAIQLGEKEVAALLSATLNEEYDADDSLTKLALGSINADAEDETSAYFRRTALNDKGGDIPTMSGDDEKMASKQATKKTAGKSTVNKSAKPAAKQAQAKKQYSSKTPSKSAAPKSGGKKAASKKTTKKKR